MDRKEILSQIYYGNELNELEKGSAELRHWFERHNVGTHRIGDASWTVLIGAVKEFFRRPRPKLFGGPITAGDGLAIAAFMAAVRPVNMFEVGAASGFSASFIIEMAQRLDLCAEGKVFLHSLDLVRENPNGNRTGQLLAESYPDFERYWQLHAPATSMDLLAGRLQLPEVSAPAIAFVDGGHKHPWPAADVLAMNRLLAPNSWMVMQDVQIMERWLADSIRHDVPTPPPVRGVQLAVNLWPATKWIGQGMCYNMAALKTDADPAQLRAFLDSVLAYPNEAEFKERDELAQAVPIVPRP